MGLFDMVKKLHPESKLFGFLAGPHGVFSNNYMEITDDYMGLYRNMGGFDMISKCQSLYSQEKAPERILQRYRQQFFTPRGKVPSSADEHM